MISHSFFHRPTHNDKVYAEDLWLLSYFHEGSPRKYVNVVWVLACYLEKCGPGRQSGSQIVCGHFITKIARTLGLDVRGNIDLCSPGIEMRMITRQELEAAEIIDRTTRMLVAEGERPPPRTEERKVELGDLMAAFQRQEATLQRQEEHQRETLAMLVSQNRHMLYHIRRYQPFLERFAQEKASEYDLPLAPYGPPDLFIPMPRQEGGSTSGARVEEDVDEDAGATDEHDDGDETVGADEEVVGGEE